MKGFFRVSGGSGEAGEGAGEGADEGAGEGAGAGAAGEGGALPLWGGAGGADSQDDLPEVLISLYMVVKTRSSSCT